MSNYSSLKATINANIKTNDNQAITGQILNSVLNQMVTSLETGYIYKGIASTSTNPGSPDEKVFYLAGAGTFTYFGQPTIEPGHLGVFWYDSSWHSAAIDVAPVINIVNNLTDGGENAALSAEMGKVLGQAQADSVEYMNDFEITDPDRNILVRFKGGDIETKNFDSSRIPLTNIPDYWKEYLDSKLPTLRSDFLDLQRYGTAFIFVTDTHWEDNEKQSPGVIKYIQDKAGIDMCVFGGDVVTAHGTRSAKLEEIRSFMDEMKAVKPIVLVGNHDYNTSDQPSASWAANEILPGEFYRLCNVPTENIVHYDGTEVENKYDEYYGYLDNESQKIRYIFLDSGAVHKPNWADTNLRISDTQIAWMTDRITELTAGWGVIIFTHIFFQSYDGTVHGIGTQIETALDSIYDSAAAKIICVVCGHTHGSVSKVSAKGYPIIASTTDSAGQTNHESLTYEPGTDTEQAFDIYFVNNQAETIEVVRIGAGDTTKDRSFTF